MNYIIFDLEWNQAPDNAKNKRKEFPFEIIEIGAVKLDENRKYAGEFYQLIKPQVYNEMYPHIKNLLGIDIEDLKHGISFEEAVKSFLEWCGKDYIFCTWGNMDLYELQRNMSFYNIPSLSDRPFVYLDIQKLYAIYTEGKNVSYALETAVDDLSIKKEKEFHDALVDAKYTAEVLKKISQEVIDTYVSVDIYQHPKSKKDEVYLVFDQYSKYITREFNSKEAAFANYNVSGIRCLKCEKKLKKNFKWFSNNRKNYYCTAYCDKHGYMKGKIQVRRVENNKVYVIKIIKSITENEAMDIQEKYIMMRMKRQWKKNI